MLVARPWLPPESDRLVRSVAAAIEAFAPDDIVAEVERLVDLNTAIHDADCINLNPAGNLMNPRGESLLARGLGSRPSLGYPAAKHEAGLEAIERIEIVAAELAAGLFGARYVELRLPSGSIANLCAFMSCTRPGDAIVVPPPSVGGHASYQGPGAAGRYGLRVIHAPVDAEAYSIDPQRLRDVCLGCRPKLLVVGGSLNLFPHPIADIRAVADEFGALLLYDAAHVAGLIAGGAWQQPLREGAHLVTMSTYKSLAGPPGGMILTDDPSLAERIETVAFPGLSANFDVAKTAALAVALADLRAHGRDYADAAIAAARTLAENLHDRGINVFGRALGFTHSHQFAVDAEAYGGAEAAKRRLRSANLLTSAIGLPGNGQSGPRGVRLGTPELVRLGMDGDAMRVVGGFVSDALLARKDLPDIAAQVSTFRRQYRGVKFTA